MTEGNGSLRNKLFKLRARRYDTKDIPGMGPCMFQSITERERSIWEQHATTKTGTRSPRKERELRQAFVALTWVDPDTKTRVLSDDDVGTAAFEEVDSAVLSQMCDAAFKWCGITEEITIEDEVKNSSNTQDD